MAMNRALLLACSGAARQGLMDGWTARCSGVARAVMGSPAMMRTWQAQAEAALVEQMLPSSFAAAAAWPAVEAVLRTAAVDSIWTAGVCAQLRQFRGQQRQPS